MSWVYHPVYLLVWRSSLTSQLLLVQGLAAYLLAIFSWKHCTNQWWLASATPWVPQVSLWYQMPATAHLQVAERNLPKPKCQIVSCWCSRNQIGAQKQWNCLNISEVEYAEDDCIKNPLMGIVLFTSVTFTRAPCWWAFITSASPNVAAWSSITSHSYQS